MLLVNLGKIDLSHSNLTFCDFDITTYIAKQLVNIQFNYYSTVTADITVDNIIEWFRISTEDDIAEAIANSLSGSAIGYHQSYIIAIDDIPKGSFLFAVSLAGPYTNAERREKHNNRPPTIKKKQERDENFHPGNTDTYYRQHSTTWLDSYWRPTMASLDSYPDETVNTRIIVEREPNCVKEYDMIFVVVATEDIQKGSWIVGRRARIR